MALPANLYAGKRSHEIAIAQIMLDRARHSPGVVDGMMGPNTGRAIIAYRQQHGLGNSGVVDASLIEHLRANYGAPLWTRYSITQDDVDGPFRNVPSGMAAKAELDSTAYGSAAEALAERFHVSLSFLKALNPGVGFDQAGTQILVPKPGGDELKDEVTRIEVDKASNELRAYTSDGKQVATYPTTVGSSVHPSPNDKLEVLAVAHDPTYHFDPSGRNWGPDRQLTIAAGPNNPVGTVWIDLSRDGFGIHGTPEPRLIGKTESHGCVRLTNWDAEELASAVKPGTVVTFI